jgi:hypothetical protein
MTLSCAEVLLRTAENGSIPCTAKSCAHRLLHRSYLAIRNDDR